MSPFRALTPEDALWLEALHAECFDATRRWSAQLFKSFLQSPAAQGHAYVMDQQPAGFILTQGAAEEAEIVTLATLPAQRRKGIALKLVENVIAAAHAQKRTRIFLEVAENNPAAIALYRKLGFEKTGVRPKYYQEEGSGVDAWIMRKSLPS